MPTALEAATALQRRVFADSGEPITLPARVYGLLYYAQGISWATRREPLFDGAFAPTSFGFEVRPLPGAFTDRSKIWWKMLMRADPGDLEGDPILRQVVQVFGAYNAPALANGIRAEAPWQTYGAQRGHVLDPTALDTEIADHFYEMLDDGKDVAKELGLTSYHERPHWELWFRVAINVKCLVGHPMFVESSSRDWRRRLDLGEEPDAWPNDSRPGDGIEEELVAVGMR